MIDRDVLLNDLRNFVIEVHFTKVDGSDRIMRCTLLPTHLPKEYVNEASQEAKFHNDNPDVIAAWDVQKGGWRSFRIDSVQYVQVMDGYN